MYQRFYFPCDVVNITQGYGVLESSHKHGYQLDDGGKYNLFAPCDCKVSKIYNPKSLSHSKEVWLTSTKKVLCSNGYYGYMTISITHPKSIEKLKVGQTFKQFEKLGINTNEMTGTSTGSHFHLEVSKGKKAGWDEKLVKKYGEYINVNKVKPQEYMFITEDTKIKNEKHKLKTYHFKKESEITYKVVGVVDPPLYIRNKDTNKVIGKLYNKDEVLKFDNNTRCLVYHYGALGLTYKKYLKK